jgi:hypothetical protein
LAVAVLFAAGCKTPASQTLLERENFQQEKAIDELRDELDDAAHELQECRRENVALKKQLGGDGIVRSPIDVPQSVTPPPAGAPLSHPPSGVPLFQPPSIDRGTATPPDNSPAAPSQSQPEQWAPPKQPPRLEKSDAAPSDSGATTSSYQEEDTPGGTRIVINRLLTNGHQFGGHTPDANTLDSSFGDNGLEIVFSFRDAKNRPVVAEGNLAIAVVDPAISGPAARVARWDFTADEVKAHYKNILFGKGYRFDLLWPHDGPQHERLKLFVRLTTPDGERLEAQQSIHVRLGTLLPTQNDANVADSPAPPGGEPTGPDSVATNSAAGQSAGTSVGEFEPDEPAPHGAESPRISAVGNGAVWKPYR